MRAVFFALALFTLLLLSISILARLVFLLPVRTIITVRPSLLPTTATPASQFPSHFPPRFVSFCIPWLLLLLGSTSTILTATAMLTICSTISVMSPPPLPTTPHMHPAHVMAASTLYVSPTFLPSAHVTSPPCLCLPTRVSLRRIISIAYAYTYTMHLTTTASTPSSLPCVYSLASFLAHPCS
jgi:hypothetical protein